MTHKIIPPEVEFAYFPKGAVDARSLGGGIINTTLLVEAAGGERLVLQQLSPIFGEELVIDYQIVTNHLKKEGWEVPALLKTQTGELYKSDVEGIIWRAFEYIASDEHEVDTDQLASFSVYGSLLGQLHVSLAKLDYQPLFSLPHFHDTLYHAEALERAQVNLPNPDARAFAAAVCRAYRKLQPLPKTGDQLIHGDPRAGNILHRDGAPFTFIDWDTLMLGTIWMDLGDMLRSLSESYVKAGQPVAIESLAEVAEAYRSVAKPDSEPQEFQDTSLKAARYIALELAMRFIADYKDGDQGYFAWDAAKYSSRHEHNMARARVQWEIFSQLQQRISPSGSVT